MLNYFNYFTEIEERFQQRRGSLLLLSTLDWALIETWREAGIPLDAVLRGIDAAFDKYEERQKRGHRHEPKQLEEHDDVRTHAEEPVNNRKRDRISGRPVKSSRSSALSGCGRPVPVVARGRRFEGILLGRQDLRDVVPVRLQEVNGQQLIVARVGDKRGVRRDRVFVERIRRQRDKQGDNNAPPQYARG